MIDTVKLLGKLITGEHKRDAIHIAVAPVIASCKLAPGQDIGFVNGDGRKLVGATDKPVGIVDPFLKNLVFPNQQFWMFLYPGSITSLVHQWEHPAFKTEQECPTEHEEWGTPPKVPSLQEVAIKAVASVKRKKENPSGETKKIQQLEEATSQIEKFAEQAELSYQDLLDGAAEFLKTGKWEGFRLPAEFWDNYEIITNSKIPDDQRRSFFTCSC